MLEKTVYNQLSHFPDVSIVQQLGERAVATVLAAHNPRASQPADAENGQ